VIRQDADEISSAQPAPGAKHAYRGVLF
jgi:hypothetical protein